MESSTSIEFGTDGGIVLFLSASTMHLVFLTLLLLVAATAYLSNQKNERNQTLSKTGTGNNTFLHEARHEKDTHCVSPSETHRNGSYIPFIVLEEPSWRSLSVTLEKYRREAGDLLKGLSQSLELALHSERELGIWYDDTVIGDEWIFSDRLQHKIQRVSDCLDHNEEQLLRMMQPFPVVLTLPCTKQIENVNGAATNRNKNHRPEWSVSKTTRLFTTKQSFANNPLEATKSHAYDCGAQVVAHIVRDWTSLGEPVRASIYDWCVSKIEQYFSWSSQTLPILVPGAGLGRLAYELSFRSGLNVEANEISLSMAAVAHAILDRRISGSVFPFALDFFANEVEAERRYDLVRFPDIERTDIQHQIHQMNASLSYTIGDFVDIYRWQRGRGSFAGIVTCFFLDTATNLYEYLATIEHLLTRGGIWVNIGPLRWHANSMLHPSVDELRKIIESSLFGFDILEWSVDTTPSEYRSEDNEMLGGTPFVRSTAYDGYRSLRFVAKKRL